MEELAKTRELSNLVHYWIMKDEQLNKNFNLSDFDYVVSRLEKLSLSEISLIKRWIIDKNRVRLNNKLIGLGIKTKNI
jgi:hypothetical protein